jgi:hypothetical protein
MKNKTKPGSFKNSGFNPNAGGKSGALKPQFGKAVSVATSTLNRKTVKK